MMKNNILLYSLVILCSLFFTNKIEAQKNDQTLIPMNPKVIKKTLANGFTYYLQKNDIPEKQVQFRMVIKAGSILETDKQRGFAHFLEHMSFNGSKHFPGNTLVDYLQTIGVEFGSDINAYTGYDQTVYMLPIPNGKAETLDKAFMFFGDILSGLTLSTKAINDERPIIHEEWRTTIGLGNRLKNAMYPLLYHNSRYLNRRPIGLMNIVTKKGNENEIRKFYHSWYRPDLANLVIVGNINVKDIEQRIQNTFGSIKVAKDAPVRKYYTVPKHKNTLVKIIKDKEITSTSVKIIQKFPHQKEETLADLKRSVINIIYTYMVNQRLTDIAQQKNAPYMYAQSYNSAAAGNVDRYMSIATVKSNKIIDGTKGLMRELLRIKKYGFTQNELDRKKDIIYNNFKNMALEADKQSSSQIVNNISNYIISGEENSSFQFKNKFVKKVLKEITLADVQKLVNQYINESNENRVIFVTAPENVSTPSKEDLLNALKEVSKEKLNKYVDIDVNKPLMNKLPKSGTIVKEEHSDKMGTSTLYFKNGVSVVLKPTTFKNDEIRFSSLREGGYSTAKVENFDNASMASTLVSLGGLSNFSSIQLDRITSGKEVYVAPYIHRYTEGVSGFSDKRDFETLLQMTYLTYTEPRIDRDRFKQFIENKKEYNRNSLNNPNSYFTDEVNKIMMQNSPRTAILLTPKKLDKISIDKAFSFYKSRFESAKGTRFIIVGSFNVDSIKPLLTRYLGGLPGGTISNKYKDYGIRPPKGNLQFDFPKNSVDKTKVLMRFTGKYPNTQIARIKMGMLSDILTIRLNQKLREEIGGVYSPYAASTMLMYPYSNYRMDIYFTCSPANKDILIKAAMGEIEDMKNNIKSENLEKGKKAWLKDRKGSLGTNGYWQKTIGDQWTRGESEKDFLNYEQQIKDVTTKQLSKLARKYLKKQNHLEFILSPEKK